jgi:hypothetical protein
MNVIHSPRVILVIIAAMFLLPLLLAWLLYSGSIDFQPASTRNLGMLLQSPVAVALEESLAPAAGPDSGNPELNEDNMGVVLSEHWVVLHAVADPCESRCLDAITQLRQIHRAAGRHQSRIQIVLLLKDHRKVALNRQLSDIYPSFHLAGNPDGDLWNSLEAIASSGPSETGAAGSTYLIDPLGNIMMYYEAGADPNKLKKDLKQLLTWSKLDEQ